MTVAPEELPQGSKLVMCISEVAKSLRAFFFFLIREALTIAGLLLDHWPKSSFRRPSIPCKPIHKQSSNF